MADASLPRNVHRALIPFPKDMLPRLDEHAERMQKKVHVRVSRTDAVIDLVTRGLRDAERSR